MKKKFNELLISVLLLFLFWIIITLPQNPISSLGFKNFIEHILIGLLLSFIISFIMPKPLFTDLEIRKIFNLRALFRLLIYFIHLFIEMIIAGVDVAYRVVGPKILISPEIVAVETPLKDNIEISLNANSITLTPGTITLDVEKRKNGSCFYIHCLSKESAEEIKKTGGFVKQIQTIFK